ncbi:hypothetical protein SEPCBS119000_000953 [Sporothrix epigloea]|uniref:Efficient mitochondria targeting-associated protein 19 n=1 Tax=Sporothrix epigloea TaxID=1892477 RepID=A0ABP0D809_9PEZI
MPLSREIRDRIWLVWFSIQIPVILYPGVDAVDNYPAWLVAEPGAPLHFLHTFRQWYVATYRDPLIDWTPARGAALGAGGSWMSLFLRIELAWTLPVVLYAVYRLASKPASTKTTGSLELLLLVYALETALTTAVCIHDVSFWNPAVYSLADKNVFRFQLFGPWLAMPALLFVDMYTRLLSRFDADSTKKIQ